MTHGSLLQQINTLTQGEFESFLLDHNICPLCLEEEHIEMLKKRHTPESGPMMVCVKCGFVPDQKHYTRGVPFGFSGAPGNALSFGNGMGGTLQDPGLFCVIAHSQPYDNDKQHLPVSTIPLKILLSKMEHPKIQTLLKHGRARCHECGFDMHNEPRAIMFSDTYARLLRKMGKTIIISKAHVNLRKIADACLALTFRQLNGEKEYAETCIRYKVDMKVLKNVLKLLGDEIKIECHAK